MEREQQSVFLKLFIRVRELVLHYQRHISVGAFLVGFAFDSLLLPRIDLPATRFLIGGYLLSVAVAIVFGQLLEARRMQNVFAARVAPFVPVFIQLIFGALWSLLFVYYFRGASLYGSWLFLLLLVFAMIGNEVFHQRYARFEFQVSVLFVTLFGATIFLVPIFLGRIDVFTFFVSGLASLAAMFVFLLTVFVLLPHVMQQATRVVSVSVLALYLVFNALYFSGSIPPIPLALSSAGVYHSLSRDAEGNYYGVRESQTWYARYFNRPSVFHRTSGEPAYVHSAIFAPAALKTPIYHVWEFYDPNSGEWVTKSRITFSIIGGREGGFRGYSMKTALEEGRWRVRVETAGGQLLGQRLFTVVNSETTFSGESTKL